MRKILWFILMPSLVVAQNKLATDLLKINNYKQKDTIKVEMIIDYCVANTFSNSDTILSLATQAHQISKDIKYPIGEMRAINCIGNYYYQQAIYDKATQFYTQALGIAEKRNDSKNIVIGKNNLGNLYTRTHQPEKALQLFKEADSILLKTGQKNSQNRAAILTNIGGLYSSLNKNHEAIKYHKQTLEICKKQNIPFGIAIATCNIGEEYVTLKDYEQAQAFLLTALQISEKQGYDNFLGKVYKNLGIVYWHQNNKQMGFNYLEKSVAVSEKINSQNALIETLQVLQTYYAETNDFENAYKTGLKLKIVNQNVNGIEKQKAVSEINTKYETEKKQHQIVTLQKDNKISALENKRQKTLVLLLSIGLFTALVLGYFVFIRYKIKKQNEHLKLQLVEAEKTLIAEKRASESELKALKSQMNPHFFFNALNTIQSYIATNETDEATNYLNKFSKLTRIILEMTDKNWVTIDEEIKMHDLYLNLQKARLSDFNFEIKVDNNVLNNAILPTMILQPYVENAIIHGLSHKFGPKLLTISFETIQQNKLQIRIEDNGIGLTKATEINRKNSSKAASFATKATQQQINIINKNEFKIVVETNECFDNNEHSKGTVVKITTDLRYE